MNQVSIIAQQYLNQYLVDAIDIDAGINVDEVLDRDVRTVRKNRPRTQTSLWKWGAK